MELIFPTDITIVRVWPVIAECPLTLQYYPLSIDNFPYDIIPTVLGLIHTWLGFDPWSIFSNPLIIWIVFEQNLLTY